MTIYVPIMKGKPGEFKAWQETTPQMKVGMRPLFEVVPKHGVDKDLELFSNGLIKTTAASSVLTIDCGYLDQTIPITGTRRRAIRWTADQLIANNLSMRPVVRIGDTPKVLSEAREVASTHQSGVCLRLDGSTAVSDPSVLRKDLKELQAELELGRSNIHLLIDMHEIADEAALSKAVTSAQNILAEVLGLGKWASVTLSSGAFPASISDLKTTAPTALLRFDAELWRSLATTHGHLNFGDYGINHPSMPPRGPQRGPLPNLRYTDARNWQVWREKKTPQGNQAYFTLCRKVTRHGASRGASFSWGDAEVDRCARSIGGAGSATQWRAHGTSHHIATVIERLATLGEP